jgi:hypothetical protein
MYVKEHLRAKCIFGCLLSILRYLTVCLGLIFIIGGKLKSICSSISAPETPGLLPGDSGVHTPESLVRVRRLRPKLPGSFFIGCRSPQIWGRRLWAKTLAEVCLRPRDSGLGD